MVVPGSTLLSPYSCLPAPLKKMAGKSICMRILVVCFCLCRNSADTNRLTPLSPPPDSAPPSSLPLSWHLLVQGEFALAANGSGSHAFSPLSLFFLGVVPKRK